MPLVVDDDTLGKLGLSEREAPIEFACRLFETRIFDRWPAAQLCGMSKLEFGQEPGERGIAHSPLSVTMAARAGD